MAHTPWKKGVWHTLHGGRGCGTHSMVHIIILFPGPTQLPYKEMEVDHPASCCLQYTGWDLSYEVLFPYKEMEVDHPASK